VLAVVSESRQMFPVNVLMIIDGVSGALELNALPKEEILGLIIPDETSRQSFLPEDGLLRKLGIFGFAISVLLVVVLIAFLLRLAFKKYLKVLRFC